MVRCLAWAYLLTACNGKPSSPPPGPTSGVDPGDDANPRVLTDLTEGERQTLCDWSAARTVGGYDASLVCESGLVVSSFIGQQACLSAFLGACMTVTVTEWEQCVDKTATDPCADYLFTAPECLAVVQCLGQTDGGPAPPPDGSTE